MPPSRVLALPLASVLLACGPSVPDSWKELVVTEGLTKALEIEGTDGGDSLMMFYARDEISVDALRTGFREKIEAAGYTRLFKCDGSPEAVDAPSDGYGKGPKGYVEVSVVPLGEDTWDLRVTRTDALMSFQRPDRADCEWLPAAADYCDGGMPTDVCLTK